MQGMMKIMPGPLAPPKTSLPIRKITTLSYSFITWKLSLVFFINTIIILKEKFGIDAENSEVEFFIL